MLYLKYDVTSSEVKYLLVLVRKKFKRTSEILNYGFHSYIKGRNNYTYYVT